MCLVTAHRGTLQKDAAEAESLQRPLISGHSVPEQTVSPSHDHQGHQTDKVPGGSHGVKAGERT